MQWKNTMIGLMSVLAAVACSDDDGGSGGGTLGGVDGTKSLSALSSSEQQAICADLAGEFEDVVTVSNLCELFGVVAASDTQSCEQYVDVCKSQPPQEVTELEDSVIPDDSECFEAGVSTCDVTVDELQTCLDAMLGTYLALANLSCTDAANTDLTDVEALDELPAACEPLQTCGAIDFE